MSSFPLDKYEENRLLGQGTFGSVYLYCLKPEAALRGRGDTSRLPATVAVKRIVVTGSNASSDGSLYDGEYELLSGLHHNNIVDLLGRKDTRLRRDIVEINLVMEACHGDLRALMSARGALPTMDASVLIRQALVGLKYLHDNNIVHKDLKPENILLHNTQSHSSTTSIDWSLVQVADIQAKISDFGLAKFYLQDDTSFTMTVAGTPLYMCPRMWEAFLKQQPYRGHWSVDQFSMGVIAYELVTGSKKQEKSSYNNASDLKAEFRGIDSDIADFLLGMLREDPSQRKSPEALLAHPFIKKGQEHLERQRERAHVRATKGSGGSGQRAARQTSETSVESLRRQVEKLEKYREQSDRAIAQLTRQWQRQQASTERALSEVTSKLVRLESKLTSYEASVDSLRKEQLHLSSLKKQEKNAEKANQKQTVVSPKASPRLRRRLFPREEHENANNDLWHACDMGNVDQIKSALDRGADIHYRKGDDIKILDGSVLWTYKDPTPLIVAASKGHVKAVEYLISRGSDVNSTEGIGQTALHSSSERGNEKIMSLLLENGASINRQDQSGNKCTALHLASYWGRISCVRLLLQRGANAAIKDERGRTAFDVAKNENVKIVFREFHIYK